MPDAVPIFSLRTKQDRLLHLLFARNVALCLGVEFGQKFSRAFKQF